MTQEQNFKVHVEWKSKGFYMVPAKSFAEAIRKVEDAVPPFDALPKGSRLVEDTMLLDKEANAIEHGEEEFEKAEVEARRLLDEEWGCNE